jgi:hypothetical protein
MMGKGVGVGSNIANSSGAFFFVWRTDFKEQRKQGEMAAR